MLMQNDAFGHVAADIYREAFKTAGIELSENWFEPGTKDYSAVLAKIGADKPEYLFPGYTDSVLYDIVQQATQLGLTKFWLVRGSLGPALKNKDYIDDYVAYIPKYFEEAEKTEPKVKKFVEAYKAYYKKDFPYDQAPLCSSSCYDHVYMLVEAMKKAGTVDDVAKVKAALLSFTLRGPVEHPLRQDRRGSDQLRHRRRPEGRQDHRQPPAAEVSPPHAAARRRPAAQRHHRRHALRDHRPRRHADLRHHRHRELRARRVHDAGRLRHLVPDRRRRHPLPARGAAGGGGHRGARPAGRPGAVPLHPQQPDQRPDRLDRPDLGDRRRRADGLDDDAAEHALRAARRVPDRRRHRAEDEGRRLPRPARRHPGHLRAR